MRKSAVLVIAAFLFLSLGTLLRAAGDFEFRIPPGWAFKGAVLSKSGLKAIVIIFKTTEGGVASQNYISKLELFDKNNSLINELTFPGGRQVQLTRDDRIILRAGDEDTQEITLIDAAGNQLFSVPTNGRRPYPALLGREIGLAGEEIGGEAKIIGPVSIIDGETGKEKISVSPPAGKGPGGFSGFLPIGEGGRYLLSLGATVYLKTYLHPEATIWKIDNIGGNVRLLIPIDEDLVGIQYQINDINAKKYLAGVAIVEWRSGKIVLKQESQSQEHGQWSFLHGAIDITREGEDLFFMSYESDDRILVPRKAGCINEWSLSNSVSYRLANRLESDQYTDDGRHLIKSRKGTLIIQELRSVKKQ